MRLKRMLLVTVATIACVVVGLTIAVPTLAAAEQGTGSLYAYTDPERTILVEVDGNGRYYVVPGTEYYFSVSGIGEYAAGQEITIWAFRANTAEDVLIETATVSSDLDVVFTWTIPEDWLDEVIKVKYEASLQSDWFYAQKEIWVNCRVGTGILYVYIDSTRNTQAPLDASGNYLVYPGTTYYFKIDGITEYSGKTISVWAFYRIHWTTYNILVASGKSQPIVQFEWAIPPDIPADASIKFKYGIRTSGPKPDWYYARRDTISAPRLLLVIPGVFLGSIGAITALFSGWAVKTLLTKRR